MAPSPLLWMFFWKNTKTHGSAIIIITINTHPSTASRRLNFKLKLKAAYASYSLCARERSFGDMSFYEALAGSTSLAKGKSKHNV